MKIDFDQFNTTVYGYDDRFRGIHGTRMVVLIHRNDMARFSLNVRDVVTLSTAVDDGGQRGVRSDGGAVRHPRGQRRGVVPRPPSRFPCGCWTRTTGGSSGV
jgi:anaerobic selenocysteine-containing dehydrogenase